LVDINGWIPVICRPLGNPGIFQTPGEGQGRLYLGSAAMENDHYSQQYALAAHLGATIFSAAWAGSQDFFGAKRFFGESENSSNWR